MINNTLKRAQIIRHKVDVDKIFNQGAAITEFPIKAVFCNCDQQSKALFSVPKKNIRKAVLRNLCRRRVKESWRVNKVENVNIAFIYISKKCEDFYTIDNAIKSIVKKIINRSVSATD